MIFALDLTHTALRYQVSVEITCYVVTFHVHKHAFYKLYASSTSWRWWSTSVCTDWRHHTWLLTVCRSPRCHWDKNNTWQKEL